LLEDQAKSYHAPHRVTDHDLFDNDLIFGDNLLARRALEQEFTGKIMLEDLTRNNWSPATFECPATCPSVLGSIPGVKS